MRFYLHGTCGAVLLALAACQTYTAQPLDPATTLNDTVARRRAGETDVLTLRAAAALLTDHNAAVRDARAAHAARAAVAGVPEPRPNPSFGVTPTYLSGPGILSSDRVGVEVAFGWLFPLGGRRKLTDERRALEADASAVHVAGTERSQYLALRGDFLALDAALRRVDVREALRNEVRKTLAALQRLARAGQATALDVHAIRLDLARADADLAAARTGVVEARSQVAARLGVTARPWSVGARPPLRSLPDADELGGLLIAHNSGLAHRRATYRMVEQDVRLEIARQYPDLALGPFLEREEGSNKWGLEIGIEIPLFDRNQVGIARARAARSEQRALFSSAVARGLDAIEAARARVAARAQHLALLKEQIEPLAEQTVALVRRALDSGNADVLRLLDALRRRQESKLDVVDAEAALYAAWSELEAACGAPLLVFPDEPVPKDPKSTEKPS